MKFIRYDERICFVLAKKELQNAFFEGFYGFWAVLGRRLLWNI